MAETTEIVAPGRIIAGRYEMLNSLASGGMAQVWIANDMQDNQSVAIKVLHQHLTNDEKFISRFKREAEAASKLSHESIVAIYDSVSERNVEAIVMELIEGETLRNRLDNQHILKPEEVLDIGTEIADGLHSAHSEGIIHRDIKPANIMLCPDSRVVITDFGIAKAAEDADLTATGMLLGTAKYLAPEQVTGGNADPRSDVYSLAVVMFEALTGTPPFLADTEAATALSRLQNPAPKLSSLNPKLNGEIEEVIAKALEKNPNNRYNDAQEFKKALLRIDRRRIGRTFRSSNSPMKTKRNLNPYGPATDSSSTQDNTIILATSAPQEAEVVPIKSNGPLSTSWVVPVLLAFLFISAFVFAIYLLISPFLSNNGDPDVSVNSTDKDVLVISEQAVLDQNGDNSENDATVPLATDSDLETSWQTETYNDPDIDKLKGGVTLVVALENISDISEIELSTPSTNWKIEFTLFDENSSVVKTSLFTNTNENVILKIPTEKVKYISLNILDTGQTNNSNYFQLNELLVS